MERVRFEVTDAVTSGALSERLIRASADVEAPITTGRRIVVLGTAGGAGATTVTAVLAKLLGSIRQEAVMAVDATDASGMLLRRLGATSAAPLSVLMQQFRTQPVRTLPDATANTATCGNQVFAAARTDVPSLADSPLTLAEWTDVCVHVQKLARARPQVAHHRRPARPRTARDPGAPEHPVHGRVRARDPGLIRQPPRAPAGALAQLADPALLRGWHPARGAVRPAGALGRHASDARSAADADRQRPTHPCTVDLDTFAQAAACANVSPSSTTRRTTSHRPRAVKRALWCGTPGLLEGRELDTHTLSAGPDLSRHRVLNVPGHVN